MFQNLVLFFSSFQQFMLKECQFYIKCFLIKNEAALLVVTMRERAMTFAATI